MRATGWRFDQRGDFRVVLGISRVPTWCVRAAQPVLSSSRKCRNWFQRVAPVRAGNVPKCVLKEQQTDAVNIKAATRVLPDAREKGGRPSCPHPQPLDLPPGG